MAKSYGPAGIFSTDNPVADQLQIDAENFVDEFDDDPIDEPCDNCGCYECICGGDTVAEDVTCDRCKLPTIYCYCDEQCSDCGHYVCICIKDDELTLEE